MDNFEDPPTPSRFSNVMKSKQLSECFNEQILADGSLAELTGEVAEAQKYQAHELADKQHFLNDLQKEFKDINAQYQLNQEEIRSINRKLYVIQDRSVSTKHRCNDLQNQVTVVLSEKMEAKKKLTRVQWSIKSEESVSLKYKKKMKSFRDVLHDYPNESDISRQVKTLQNDVEEKKLEYSDICLTQDEPIYIAALGKEIVELTCRLKEIDKENTTISLLVQSEQERVTILKNEIDAIHKRKCAHLSRLNRQVHDSSLRVAQWKRDIKDLENRISAGTLRR